MPANEDAYTEKLRRLDEVIAEYEQRIGQLKLAAGLRSDDVPLVEIRGWFSGSLRDEVRQGRRITLLNLDLGSFDVLYATVHGFVCVIYNGITK